MTNEIDYTRDSVQVFRPDWQKVRDVLGGERVIKKAGDTYLPRPNPTDKSAENIERYNQYVERACWLGATKRTLDGMIGISLRQPPMLSGPAPILAMVDDIDGRGKKLYGQVRTSLEECLSVGRLGLLVDYPRRPNATSIAEQNEGNIHPTICLYRTEQIINWSYNERGKLELVVLHEWVEIRDGYAVVDVEQWRELMLDDKGIYHQRVWKKDDADTLVIESDEIPKAGNGKPFRTIPFQPIGAIDNDIEIDRAPLYDMAGVNIALYRNSADYEESVHFSGQPTVAVNGLDEHWANDVLKGTVHVGSRAGIPLPVGADIKLVQADPNNLAGEAMKDKRGELVMLGARLLMPGEAAKTAEQSRSDTAAHHSVLSLCCDNVTDAFNQAFTWAADFAPADGEIKFEIDTEFVGLMLNPQLITAVVDAWQKGAMPTSDKNTALKIVGLIDPLKTDEEIQSEIDDDGAGLNLDVDDPGATSNADPGADPDGA